MPPLISPFRRPGASYQGNVDGETELIELKELRASRGGSEILHDISLSLRGGEIYGLLGPNGAGKSTTIAVALGLLKPDSGQVRLFGEDPAQSGSRLYGRLGVVPEQDGFYSWMSAEEYLTFFAALYEKRLAPGVVQGRLSAVGLKSRPRQTIGSYSRGMRQRLGLARALIADPHLLVLDEPTDGLDPRGRRAIHDILLGQAARGVGVLLCTHLLDDVERLCGRIGIMVEGRTVAEGNLADLIRDKEHLARFHLRLDGEPPGNFPPVDRVSIVAREGEWWTVDLDPVLSPDLAWRELLFRGWPVAEIRRDGGGLEGLYLALTERQAA